MRSTMSSSAAVGGLVLLCLASVATAQTTVVAPRPVTHLASVPPGTISGQRPRRTRCAGRRRHGVGAGGHERVCGQRSIRPFRAAHASSGSVSRSSASRRFRRVTRSGCRSDVRADARHPRLLFGTRTPCARPARCSRAWAVVAKKANRPDRRGRSVGGVANRRSQRARLAAAAHPPRNPEGRGGGSPRDRRR